MTGRQGVIAELFKSGLELPNAEAKPSKENFGSTGVRAVTGQADHQARAQFTVSPPSEDSAAICPEA
jgi:hypothetical protein